MRRDEFSHQEYADTLLDRGEIARFFGEALKELKRAEMKLVELFTGPLSA